MTGDLLPEKVEAQPLAISKPDDPMSILRIGVEKGIDPEGLEKLSALAERWADRQAAQEFAAAMAEFRKKCPEITKRAPVKDKNGKILYHFAKLYQIRRIIDPILDDLGLTYWWDSETVENRVTTTCHLQHVSGHARKAHFTVPNDQGTSLMSAAQKAASGKNFARRQTLIDVLGMTTADPDDDGAGGGVETITGDQIRELDAQLADSNADRGRFLLFARVDRLEDIPACRFDALLGEVKRKAREA